VIVEKDRRKEFRKLSSQWAREHNQHRLRVCNPRKLETWNLRLDPDLSAFSRAVTFSAGRRAVARLGQLAVRPDAGLSVDAPEQAFIRMRHGWVGLGQDELRLPAQGRAEAGMIGIEAIGFLKR